MHDPRLLEEEVKAIRIEEFDYPLPEEKIALFPLRERDSCRLIVDNGNGAVSHRLFSELPLLLSPDALIVANETKVIRARMEFAKESGARIEIFLLEPHRPRDYAENFASTIGCEWDCLIGNKKRWKEAPLKKTLTVGDREVTLVAAMARHLGEDGDTGNSQTVFFSWNAPDISFAEIVEAAGRIPIPPYLKRESRASDTTDYQTVFSKTEGSVAAPTAGLHFTPRLIEELKRHGNEIATVTLHVGAGTFQPVKSEEIGAHPMHSEWFSVTRLTLRRIIDALENGRDIVAVGTTSVRTLESLPYLGLLVMEGVSEPGEVTQWMPYEGKNRRFSTLMALRALLGHMEENGLQTLEATTSIMIAPGFRWRVVDKLITNFHQPKSTLLLLVSSFLGKTPNGEERWRGIYDEALEKGYRFLSYGDACLLARGRQPVELPPSKSMALRAAMIYAVAHPGSPGMLGRIPAGCDDVRYFVDAMRKCMLSRLGPGLAECYIGEGAAPLRFLVAYAASLEGVKLRITCAPPLRRRPIRPLIDTLAAMGAGIEFNDDPEEWEIVTEGRTLEARCLEVDTSVTSQYLSALMLVSPLWKGEPTTFEAAVKSAAVSRPYLRMTEVMMAENRVEIEPDWSAAAFFYEMAMMRGVPVKIVSLTPPARSLQGDAGACEVFGKARVTTEFHSDGSAILIPDTAALRSLENETLELDFTDCPDMVPSLAVGLCYRRIPFIFRGVGHLRYKETDRLAALQGLLSRLGYGVGIEGETLVYNGEFLPMEEFPVEIDPYGDHRMAMAFYPMELLGMVRIAHKAVVSKSFPDFYQQFK